MFVPSNMKKYVKDQRGQFSIMAGGCFAAIVFLCGAGIDVARLSNAKVKAQGISDAVGLAAAVYVDQNGEPPTSSNNGFIHGQYYNAADYGYDLYGSKDATFRVFYDDVTKEATVELGGHIPTTFTSIAGYQTMPLTTRTVVKYKETDYGTPASIMFVLDNSGSMFFDDKAVDPDTGARPADVVRRIDGLKDNMHRLNDRLQEIADQEGDVDFLRTGMMPYHHAIISANKVNMHWGALSDGNIDAMVPGGATNSSPPMTESWNQLKNEHIHHENESGKTPLKYVIFMTDGKNTNGVDIWIPEEGTNHWRREWQEWRCWYNRWGRRRCREITREEFYPTDGPSDTPIPEPTDHNNWVEGKYVLNWDYYTQNTCKEMHAQGVKVYTIGFALKEGTYYTNEWGQALGSEYHYRDIDTQDLGQSFALLSACASEGDHFILAEDTEELNQAFDRIGDDILLDVIRIKG